MTIQNKLFFFVFFVKVSSILWYSMEEKVFGREKIELAVDIVEENILRRVGSIHPGEA